MRFALVHGALLLKTLNALSCAALGALVLQEHRSSRPVWGGRFFGIAALVGALYCIVDIAAWVAPAGPAADVLAIAAVALRCSLAPLVLSVVYVHQRARIEQHPRLWQMVVVAANLAPYVAWGAANRDVAFTVSVAVPISAGSIMLRKRLISLRADERKTYSILAVLFLLLVLQTAVRFPGDPGWIDATGDLLLTLITFFLTYFVLRLAFFDVLVKRVTFFCFGLTLVSFYFYWVPPLLRSIHWRHSPLWAHSIAISPLLLLAPWAFSRWTLWLDRVWLGRRSTPLEATGSFLLGLRDAVTEAEMCAKAEQLAGMIFNTTAVIALNGSASERIDCQGAIAARIGSHGVLQLAPRPSQIRYLSEDVALLTSLADQLDILLLNLRLREQHTAERARARELELLSNRAGLRALRAQINPHFLFNSLAAVAGLITTNPARAEATVEQLAQVFRHTLHRSEVEWTSLEEELSAVEAYLEVEQARLGPRLRVEFDIDASAKSAWVPIMSLQVLAENAVKHGIVPLKTPGLVEIRASRSVAGLHLQVLDSGSGFQSDHTPGHGLRNLRERLQGYFGKSGCLHVGRTGTMTSVVLDMPYLVFPPEKEPARP